MGQSKTRAGPRLAPESMPGPKSRELRYSSPPMPIFLCLPEALFSVREHLSLIPAGGTSRWRGAPTRACMLPSPFTQREVWWHPWKIPQGKGPGRQGWVLEAHLPFLLALQSSHFTTVESMGFITAKEEGNSVQKWPLWFRNTLEEHTDKIHRQHTDPLTEGILLDHVQTHSFPHAPHVTTYSSPENMQSLLPSHCHP